ncbi:SatD family protein [Nocardioides alcanivorans]|uniref:SatD family protein n=1 Tax=Nocardioides alcanivorans TaxID=2897352 RepID=UPI001F3A8657|nr:SatD family protein [Nocardioides alcanivorans]
MKLATLIGDVVSSRAADDRSTLHAVLLEALARVNAEYAPAHPLRVTVGDEYQGAFTEVGAAVRASLALRLELREYDVRHGLGWGTVTILQEEPRVEDGPGWWAARAAIEAVHAEQERAATRWRRTAFRTEEAQAALLAQAVEAALVLRDQAVDRLDIRSLSVLSGMLAGRTQREIGEELQVSASAVSQRIRAGGLTALAAAQEVWTMSGEGQG